QTIVSTPALAFTDHLWPSHDLPLFFFFKPTPTPEIYTLSLHDALPIFFARFRRSRPARATWPSSPTSPCSRAFSARSPVSSRASDRKSTRLNSSHEWSSYAVFCLKKKNILGILRRSRFVAVIRYLSCPH